MPESVTVSILSLGTNNTKAGNDKNDYSSKENIELPLPPPRWQGRAVTLTAYATLKTPHHSGVGLQTQSPEPGNPTINDPTSVSLPLFNNYHTNDAPASTKRTRKVAKPNTKAKAKASSCARQFSTKKNRGASKSTPKESKPPPSNRPAYNSKIGGKAATALFEKSPQGTNIHPRTKNSKAKNKRSKLLSPNGEVPTKWAKKLKMTKDLENTLSSNTQNQQASSTKQGGGGESAQTPLTRKKKPEVTFPSTITKDSQIENVVGVVVDMVANQIHCCASVFGAKRPTTVIDSEDLLDKKIPSITGAAETARKPSVDSHQEEFKSSTALKGSGVCASCPAAKKQGAALSTSYSVNTSSEQNIHPVKNDFFSLQTSEHGISANSESHTKPVTFTQEGSLKSEMHDVRTVVIAVRRFALEVYCPFILSAKKSTGNNTPDVDRIRISTLLAIREMLIMNADKLFAFSSLKQSFTSEVKNERIYLSHVFANSIVRGAAKRFHFCHPERRFFADFIQATQNYDTKSDDFQYALARADARSIYAHTEGVEIEQQEKQESVLTKIGFNYARARHPLFYNEKLVSEHDAQMGVVQKERLLTHPVPTACTSFHIEAAAASDETERDSHILESLKRVLRSKGEAS